MGRTTYTVEAGLGRYSYQRRKRAAPDRKGPTMAVCEDAPCCGCCGTNLYGVSQESAYDDGPWGDLDDVDYFDDEDEV